MFEKILTLYDLSEPSKKAVEWGICLGGHFRSQVQILHVLPQPENLADFSLANRPNDIIHFIRKEIEKDLLLYADSRAGKEPKSNDIEIASGKPVQTILKVILDKAPNLVIVGAHGKTGLQHVLLGNVAENIIRHSPAPVLIARKHPSEWPPKKILVPSDFSPDTEEALTMAVRFAKEVGAQLELLHVLTESEVLYLYEASDEDEHEDLTSRMRQAARDKLKEAIAKYPSAQITSSIAMGSVADEICNTAKKSGADLIVIATHGRTGLGHLLMGSNAEHVARYAPCNVLSFCPSSRMEKRKELIRQIATHA